MQGLTKSIGVLASTATLHAGRNAEHAHLLQNFIAGADGDLLGSAFTMEQVGVRRAIQQHTDAGYRASILRDVEYQPAGSLGEDIDVLYGDLPDKNHAKHYSIAGGDGLVQTWAVQPWTGEAPRLDFSVHLRGTDARALERLTRAQLSGDPRRILAAAENAATRGILENSPADGVYLGRAAQFKFIDKARERLLVGTKLLRSERAIEHLAAAKERGVDVILDIDHGSGFEAAQRVGLVPRRVGDRHGLYLHGNVMVADGELVMVSSAPLSKRALGGATAQRASRELSVIMRSPAAAEHALRSLAQLSGSRALQHL